MRRRGTEDRDWDPRGEWGPLIDVEGMAHVSCTEEGRILELS